MWLNECKAEIDLSLKRMNEFKKEWKQNFKAIHVGGTNGKGSVSHFIAGTISKKYKVGLYTSPHLQRVNERIKINGEEIKDDELESYRWLCKYNFTYFEALTAMALKYFEERSVDYAVIEVGMGGRYDATNIVEPEITIIANVAIEHTQWLGDSVEKIAREKAGIIKGAPVITACKGKALEVIKRIAKEKGSEIYVEGEHFKWSRYHNGFLIESNEKYFIKPKMNALYQGSNIAMAVKALELLDMEKDVIIEGIESVTIPARMERIGRFIIDGAHNPAAIKALVMAMEEMKIEPIVIFGAMKDKDVKKMIEFLLPIAKKLIVTKARNDRAMEPEKISEFHPSIVAKNVEEAIEIAEKMDGDIAIVGSLYLAGEARSFIKSKNFD